MKVVVNPHRTDTRPLFRPGLINSINLGSGLQGSTYDVRRRWQREILWMARYRCCAARSGNELHVRGERFAFALMTYEDSH